MPISVKNMNSSTTDYSHLLLKKHQQNYQTCFHPKSSSVARRNARERNRVKQVNNGFRLLQQHLPTPAKQKKMSKVETLRKAVDYIKTLQEFLDCCRDKNSIIETNCFNVDLTTTLTDSCSSVQNPICLDVQRNDYDYRRAGLIDKQAEYTQHSYEQSSLQQQVVHCKNSSSVSQRNQHSSNYSSCLDSNIFHDAWSSCSDDELLDAILQWQQS